MIRWAAVPGAARYRLVLTARQPEGGLLASIEAWVDGQQFVPPSGLVVTTAVVTLAVAAECNVAPPAAPATHRFYIDMRPGCRLAEAPRVEAVQGRRRIIWQKAANADRYEVLGYAAFDGRLLFSQETREPWLAVPDPAIGPLAIMVRPHCGPIAGAPAYGFD